MTTSAPYYGDSAVMRTPPPDLPSLLLKERIVYLGLPLFSDDDAKRQMGIDVTELIIAQLLFLEFDNPEKPIYFYINSTGTSWYSGDAIGFETEAFAICDSGIAIAADATMLSQDDFVGISFWVISMGM
jgi:ATP-dependent Clp protease protease subunit